MADTGYTITIADLQQYLAGFGPEETVGICRNSTSCLLARALKSKYDLDFEAWSLGFTLYHSLENFETTRDIRHVVSAFDDIGPYGLEVTRSQVEAAIPSLKGN